MRGGDKEHVKNGRGQDERRDALDEVAIDIDEDTTETGVPIGRVREDSEYTQARSSVSVPTRRGVSSESGRGLSLEQDDSVEWMVFKEGSTTADIRHKVFERSVSIQPSR